MGSLWKATLGLAILVCLVACADDKPPLAPRAAGTAASAANAPMAPKLPSLVDPEAGGEKDAKPEFVYSAKDLRDPFTPYIRLEAKKSKKKAAKKIFVPKTPLQRYALDELKLVGIIWAQERSKAVIEDPEGKGYFVASGTYVGDQGGKITRIQHDMVLVEERHLDMMGAETIKQITLTLHKTEMK